MIKFGPIRGMNQMRARIQNVLRAFPTKVAAALYAEAEIEMTEMKRRTPVDEGVLRDSGTVHRPEIGSDRAIRVALSFGGPAESYAVFVHEDLDAFHGVGQAKFMESVILESAPFIARRVAARLKLEAI